MSGMGMRLCSGRGCSVVASSRAIYHSLVTTAACSLGPANWGLMPAWAFAPRLGGGDPSAVAMATSHELGHTLVSVFKLLWAWQAMHKHGLHQLHGRQRLSTLMHARA